VGKMKLVVCGGPVLGDVETAGVGNFNSVLCECFGRLVRQGKCFFKVKCCLVCVVGLFLFYWSFIMGLSVRFLLQNLRV